jgi:multiple sugar transport system substrate-binding protein
MRKSILLILALLLCSAVAMASGTGDAKAAEDVKEITVKSCSGCSDWKSIEPLTKQFEEASGIKVNMEAHRNMKEAMMTAFAGGATGIDTFIHFPSDTDFEDAGYVIPLDGSVMPEAKLPDYVVNEMYPGFKEYLTYKGKIWAWPFSTDTTLLVYRTDILKKAGMAQPPKSWDDLVKFAKAGTEDTNNDGITDIFGYSYFFNTGSGVGSSHTTFRQYLWNNGGEYVDKDNNAVFASKEGVGALQFLADLRDKYKVVPPNVAQLGEDDVESLFMAGKIGGMLGFPKTSGRANAEGHALKGKVYITPHPYSVKPKSRLSGGAWYLPKATKKPLAALKYIEFITSEESCRFMHKIGLDWSPLLPRYEDPILAKEMPDRARFMKLYGASLKAATPEPRFKGKGQADAALSRWLDKIATGAVGIEEGLKSAQDEVNRIIKANR